MPIKKEESFNYHLHILPFAISLYIIMAAIFNSFEIQLLLKNSWNMGSWKYTICNNYRNNYSLFLFACCISSGECSQFHEKARSRSVLFFSETVCLFNLNHVNQYVLFAQIGTKFINMKIQNSMYRKTYKKVKKLYFFIAL